jgi:hypothetical protein
MFDKNQKSVLQDRRYQWLIGMSLFALLVLMIASIALQIYVMLDDNPAQVEDSDQVLERAEDAVNSAQLILSFLEGSTLLIVLGLGAAAIFGYRNSRELREEMNEVLDDVRGEFAKLSNLRTSFEPYRENLESLPAQIEKLNRVREDMLTELESIQPILANLLQANQELNLRNYPEAYRFVINVLERAPDNLQALYVAGWLELQYIPGKLEAGLKHLKHAMRLDPDSPSMKAAYGVGLRRTALREASAQARDNLFIEAEGYLKQALGQNPNLIDLNRESFWGPVGGIQRDMNRLQEAIQSYEKALNVTPGSSYPMGNLAALYLQQAQNKPDQYEKVLDAFDATNRYAGAELAFMPKDYFLMMDMAMANTILGERNKANFKAAGDWLSAAISMSPSRGMLRVSLNGWQRLYNFCPKEWAKVKEHLGEAIQQLEAAAQELEKQGEHENQ